RAVDRDTPMVPARAGLVNHSSDELLAGPRLSLDEDRAVRGCHRVDVFEDGRELRARSNQFGNPHRSLLEPPRRSSHRCAPARTTRIARMSYPSPDGTCRCRTGRLLGTLLKFASFNDPG